jgi:hypothetical protein
MRPAVLRPKDKEWRRDGLTCKYEDTDIDRENKAQKYCALTFSYTPRHDYEALLFAHSPPYTTGRLQMLLDEVARVRQRGFYSTKTVLCQSAGTNPVYCLEIGSSGLKKEAIVVMARQHPG